MSLVTKIDANATYIIHRSPLSDLQRNQEAAFISAGCPASSFGPPGLISTCTPWDSSALESLPPILGGTGLSGCLELQPATLQAATAYHQTTGWVYADRGLLELEHSAPRSPARPFSPRQAQAPPSPGSRFEVFPGYVGTAGSPPVPPPPRVGSGGERGL